ncbi:MAG: hypothetical protein K940chlam2_01108 [Chlamydiae bacterium]|nr:hypothetical protein [Chlamydiota bacterium]
MRRSICQVNPSIAFAGTVRTWEFIYTPAVHLSKGAKLKFDLKTQLRPTDWELPEVSDTPESNAIWLQLPSGKTLIPEEVPIPGHFAPAYEFTLPEEVKAGDTLSIFMGTPKKEREEQREDGNTAQQITQRRRPFYLYVDPKGKGDYKEHEVFTLDVRGGPLENIKIITPSIVSKNFRFDVMIRFEDAHGNLTGNAPEGMLIELTYENLRENLNWKLFVPETGFLVLPNLYFNEPGNYRIHLNCSDGDKLFFSAPIKCFAETDRNLYWGTLHGESPRIDASEHIESYLRHIRDEKAHHFTATSPFESVEETPNDTWKLIGNHVAEYNEENRFTALLGFQWESDENEGLRQFLCWKDSRPLLRKKEAKNSSLKKIFKSHTPKEFISIPSFTMGKGCDNAFEDFDITFQPVVEIYNAWGSSECTEAEGNLRPIKTETSLEEHPKGSLRAALNQNLRFGFVAGGYDDRGYYSDFFESGQVQYTPGLTALLAIEQTRDALMMSLINRSCYATTGVRMVVGFHVAGASMGTELNTINKPGLAFNRHISGYVCGTDTIKEIQIIRNGETLHTLTPNAQTSEFEYDDFQPIEDVALASPDERPPFVYYYLRAVQNDGHIAWSSPIWVDLAHTSTETLKKAPKKKGV